MRGYSQDENFISLKKRNESSHRIEAQNEFGQQDGKRQIKRTIQKTLRKQLFYQWSNWLFFWPRVRLGCVVRSNCIVGLFLGDKF